jgi:hypothetical protein
MDEASGGIAAKMRGCNWEKKKAGTGLIPARRVNSEKLTSRICRIISYFHRETLMKWESHEIVGKHRAIVGSILEQRLLFVEGNPRAGTEGEVRWQGLPVFPVPGDRPLLGCLRQRRSGVKCLRHLIQTSV